jgi:DNA-binding IscR family transcriptional regulator
VQREVWQAIEESAQRLLTATTLGELVERQERRSEAAMYYI